MLSTIDPADWRDLRENFDAQLEILINTPTLPVDFVTALEEELETQKVKPPTTRDASIIGDLFDLETLSQGNDRPSHAQMRSLNALITQHIAEAAEVDRDMALVQIKVNRLLDEMKALGRSKLEKHATVASFRALLVPVRLLPPEILTKIFEFVLPHKVFPVRTSSPLALSHVCTKWRNVALASSALWNGLCIDLYRHTNLHQLSQLITSWFSRVRNTRPLSFSLTDHVSFNGRSMDITSSIIPFLHRFAELRFENVHPQTSANILSLPRGRLPLLETLVLETSDTHPLDTDLWDVARVSVFDAAPRLHTATFGISSPVIADESRFAFPWSQLTCLIFQRAIALHTFSKLIVQCLRLRTASFRIHSQDEVLHPQVPPNSIVVFPHLSVLEVQLCRLEDTIGLTFALCKLRFPTILVLKVAGDPECLDFPLASIRPAITESLGSIRSLVLSYVSIEIDSLFGLISASPLLERLALRTVGASFSDVLKRLQPNSSDLSESRLPLQQLTSFAFGILTTSAVDTIATEFVNLIVSWVCDASRTRPLENVSFLILKDEGGDPDSTRQAHAACDSLKWRLEPWIRGDEDNPGAGFVLNARVTDVIEEV